MVDFWVLALDALLPALAGVVESLSPEALESFKGGTPSSACVVLKKLNRSSLGSGFSTKLLCFDHSVCFIPFFLGEQPSSAHACPCFRLQIEA